MTTLPVSRTGQAMEHAQVAQAAAEIRTLLTHTAENIRAIGQKLAGREGGPAAWPVGGVAAI